MQVTARQPIFTFEQQTCLLETAGKKRQTDSQKEAEALVALKKLYFTMKTPVKVTFTPQLFGAQLAASARRKRQNYKRSQRLGCCTRPAKNKNKNKGCEENSGFKANSVRQQLKFYISKGVLDCFPVRFLTNKNKYETEDLCRHAGHNKTKPPSKQDDQTHLHA